ncbi:adenosine deaminase-like protein, partial [Pluteus cervinus]
SSLSNDAVQSGIQKLLSSEGVKLEKITDFFGLFPSIYALTSTKEALGRVTRAVLESFLGTSRVDEDIHNGHAPQAECAYLELRSTPRQTDGMTREEYICTIVEEAERYPAGKVGIIVSLDRKMSGEVMDECVEVASKLRKEGKAVVGVDLCGDPLAGDVVDFERYFRRAKEAGLKVTLHVAETTSNSREETLKLLSYGPDRLGHATFLDDDAIDYVVKNKIPIEICLTSNLLCKTVSSLDEHHIRHYLKHDHPISICTDDTLPFRTTSTAEYALLLAKAPLGLGLSEGDVEKIARMSMEHRFV